VFRPSSKWYYDADYPSYDLEEAKRLVEEYEADKGPLTFSYSVLSTPVSIRQGELIKSMLEEAGMQVNVKSTDASTFIVDGALGQYQMIQWGQFGSPDPDYEHVWWYSANANPVGQLALNFPRNKDPEVDAALNRARATDDFETRKAAYVDLQKRFAADVPYAFLDYPTPIKVANNRVRGILQDKLPNGEQSVPMGGPGSFSLVTRLTQTWVVS
jgi:peptide/nickel transport system substrate-binding protein